MKTLKDIIDFNERNREKEMPYFGQDTFLKAQEKGPLTTQEYVDALAKNHQLARKEGIDATMDKNNLDALDRTHRRTRVAHRPHQRRFFRRRQLQRRSSGRLPQHHRARRIHLPGCRSAFPSSAAPGASPC